jgi:hypothetical protein
MTSLLLPEPYRTAANNTRPGRCKSVTRIPRIHFKAIIEPRVGVGKKLYEFELSANGQNHMRPEAERLHNTFASTRLLA